MDGDLDNLAIMVENLRQQNPQQQNFAYHIQQLINLYQSDQIEELLQYYLKESPKKN